MKGLDMKNYQNVTNWEILGASLLGATIGGVLALVYVLSTGGF
jgi:hypothetical protein